MNRPICCREIMARGNKRLTVVNKAVGAIEGEAELYLKSATAVASLVLDWHQKTDDLGTITAPVTRLDKAIEQYGVPAFCKIDVEGFEAEVLKGLSHPISTLILEYHTRQHGIKFVRAA